MSPRSVLRASGTVGVAVGLVVAVRSLGSGRLAAPPLSFDGFATWMSDTAPIDVAMSLLRLGAEIACWYLLAVAVVHALATFTRAPVLQGLERVMATPLPRRLGRLVVGVSLATTAGPAALSGQGPQYSSPPTTMVALGDEANPAVPTMTNLGSDTDEVAVAGPTPAPELATGGPVDPDDFAVGGPARVPVATSEQAPSPRSEPASTWTVVDGESFWVIATETMSDLLGRPATDGEIAPYWNALIEANRHRLVDPQDPDLILPGQVFDLPEPVRT